MKLTVRETAVFGMLGALMYVFKVIMEAAPQCPSLGCIYGRFCGDHSTQMNKRYCNPVDSMIALG